MQARMSNPATTTPGALKALFALSKSTEVPGLPAITRHLIDLRASQINGCGFCIDLHWQELRRAGDSDQRIFAVGGWRDAPWFNEAERAALSLTEAVTRLSDRPDPVPDGIWDDAAKHYDEPTLGALVLRIAMINTWNRLNVTTGQVAGTSWT